jgi:hypothetical protein
MAADEGATSALSAPRRYREPRVLLRWDKNDRLRVLKMLAWVVYEQERIHNADALARRVAALCEPVMLAVLGEPDVTLDAISAQTTAEQGIPITAVRLQQRADKTERYGEFNQFALRVIDAHDAVVNGLRASALAQVP